MISSYAPTLINSKKNPTAANKFYEELENTINTFSKRYIILICDGTNAQIRKDHDNFTGHAGKFGTGCLNANGERLCDFIVRNNLFMTNMSFQHKIKHRVTWISPNEHLNCIDKRPLNLEEMRIGIKLTLSLRNVIYVVQLQTLAHIMGLDHKSFIGDVVLKLYRISMQRNRCDWV